MFIKSLKRRQDSKMKLYIIFLLVHGSWLPQGQAQYHERSMLTFTPPHLKPDSSYFGFSITYEVSNKRLIVGAPRGDNIGQVFSCDIETQNCTTIPLNIKRPGNRYQHDFWLGASVKSGPEYFYTCAPRAVGKFMSRKFERFGSKGACVKIEGKNHTRIVELENIDDSSRYDGVSKYGQAVDSFGWSMDVGPNESFLIGGPAMFTGRVRERRDLGSSVRSLTGRNVNIKFNFGYSVAISNFIDTDKRNFNYAIGSPYGIVGFGKVLVYNIDAKNTQGLRIAYTLESKSAGVAAMFGAVLCAAHMSGPAQAAALLVGAPAHALGHDHDVGAVYVYLKNTQIRVIKGETSGAYFGLAIANVGDLNGDNRDDVAIAAPYEAEGRGVVYVYCGATVVGESAGLEPLQRLQPRPGAPVVQGFGLALAPLPDYDDNGCNELAIGAPYSDSVSLLRCFAAVIMEVDAVFPDLKGRNTSYFEFDSCIRVTMPNKPEVIIGSVNVTLIIIHPDARLADSSDSEYTVPLQPKHCRKVKISTPPTGNYATFIEWKISAVLIDNPSEREDFNASRVLLSSHSILSRRGSVWAAECESDTCEPNLSLAILTRVGNDPSKPYLIGSSGLEAFTIEVHNSGDAAYDSCVHVRIEGTTIRAGSVAECSRDMGTYICKPPGSLRNEQSWHPHDDITMDMTQLTNENKELHIFADLYPYCDSSNKTKHEQTIYLKSDSDHMVVKGKSNPGDIVKITQQDFDFMEKQIEHVYTISNLGVTNWVNIEYSVTYLMRPFIYESSANAFIDSMDYLTRCIDVTRTPNKVTVTCVIKKLNRNDKIAIIVPIYITTKLLDKLWNHGNETVKTFISLNLDGHIINDGISSTLVLSVAVVPLYIGIAGVCLGLLLLGILALALYKCGFLKRKAKENLEILKKDVKRQSMRKSMLAELLQRQQNIDRDETEATCTIESTEEETTGESLHKSTDQLVDS